MVPLAPPLVADHDRLAERFRKLLADRPGDEIRRAAGRHRHHQRDGPAGIAVLRPRRTGDDRNRGYQQAKARRWLSCRLIPVVHSAGNMPRQSRPPSANALSAQQRRFMPIRLMENFRAVFYAPYYATQRSASTSARASTSSC